MSKLKFYILLVAPCFFYSLVFAQEQITITTYYPSPFGSYRELRARRVAIGNNYLNLNNACWNDPVGSCPAGTTIVPDNTDLVVEGRVGLGTTEPSERLDVQGNVIARGVPGAPYPTFIVQRSQAIGRARFTQYGAGISPRAYLTSNLFWDGSNWKKDNANTGSIVVDFGAENGPAFRVRHAAFNSVIGSGINPSGLSEFLTIDTDGKVEVNDSIIYPPRSGFPPTGNDPAANTGELAYYGGPDAFYYYNGNNWLPQGGGGGASYVAYGTTTCATGWTVAYTGLATFGATSSHATDVFCKAGGLLPNTGATSEHWTTGGSRTSSWGGNRNISCALCVK